MKKSFYYNILIVFTLFASASLYAQSDTLVTDTTLAFPFSNNQTGGLFLNTPPNISSTVQYNLDNNQYLIQSKIGSLDFGRPTIMNFNEFQLYNMNRSIADYWNIRTNEDLQKENYEKQF